MLIGHNSVKESIRLKFRLSYNIKNEMLEETGESDNILKS